MMILRENYIFVGIEVSRGEYLWLKVCLIFLRVVVYWMRILGLDI